jgi:Ca2+-binding RTX toxin-like protein
VTTGDAGQTINADSLLDAVVLTLAGADDVTITLVAGDLTSTSIGNVTVTATTGSNIITTDAGNDIITGGAGADDITGGGGLDVYMFGGTGDSTDAAMDIYRGVENTETFDFSGVTAVGGGAITVALVANQAGADVLINQATIVNGLVTGFVIGNGAGVAASVAADVNEFAEVLAAVRASVDAVGELAVFSFGLDEYIFIENGAADVLIQLVGVNVTGVAVAAEVVTVTI